MTTMRASACICKQVRASAHRSSYFNPILSDMGLSPTTTCCGCLKSRAVVHRRKWLSCRIWVEILRLFSLYISHACICMQTLADSLVFVFVFVFVSVFVFVLREEKTTSHPVWSLEGT